MIDVSVVKNKIIEYIRSEGICLPVRIAKAVSMEPIFVSAILSEMSNSHLVKTTYFRLGSSLFYYLEGQEDQVEKIGEKYLGGVERETFLLLKKEKIIIEDEQTPAIRVALKNIKDFAYSFKLNDKNYWRYYLVSEKDAIDKINASKEIDVVQEELSKEQNVLLNTKEQIYEKIKEINSNKSELEIVEVKKNEQEKNEEKTYSNTINIRENPKFESPISEKKENKIIFLDEVKLFLKKMGFDYLDIIEDNKNEIIGSIIANTSFGKNKYLVVARNKKILNDNDVLLAKEKSDSLKMPLIILGKDKLNKKAIDFINSFSNLIKFYKI